MSNDILKLIYEICADTLEIKTASFSLPDGTVIPLNPADKPKFKEIMARAVINFKTETDKLKTLDDTIKRIADQVKLKEDAEKKTAEKEKPMNPEKKDNSKVDTPEKPASKTLLTLPENTNSLKPLVSVPEKPQDDREGMTRDEEKDVESEIEDEEVKEVENA